VEVGGADSGVSIPETEREVESIPRRELILLLPFSVCMRFGLDVLLVKSPGAEEVESNLSARDVGRWPIDEDLLWPRRMPGGAGLFEGEPSTADSLYASSNASWLWSSAAINGRSAASLPNLDLNLDGVMSPTGESIESFRACLSMEFGEMDRGGRDGESDSTRET
jgi:hypothetical protein